MGRTVASGVVDSSHCFRLSVAGLTLGHTSTDVRGGACGYMLATGGAGRQGAVPEPRGLVTGTVLELVCVSVCSVLCARWTFLTQEVAGLQPTSPSRPEPVTLGLPPKVRC